MVTYIPEDDGSKPNQSSIQLSPSRAYPSDSESDSASSDYNEVTVFFEKYSDDSESDSSSDSSNHSHNRRIDPASVQTMTIYRGRD
jgi:hypothetical protein